MEEQKDKRVLNIELSNEVKKVSITGKNSDEKVVMRQELDEDDLDMVTGGSKSLNDLNFHMVFGENQIKDGVLRNAPVNPGYGPLNICDKKG